MKKFSVLLSLLVVGLSAGPAAASAFKTEEALAPPPTADEIVRDVVGETSPIYGIGSDETTQVVKRSDSLPFVSWGATAIWENSVGIGSFVDDQYQRRSQWDMLWSFRAKLYLFQKLLFVQARIDLNQPVIDNADSSTTHNNQFTISDTYLTIMAPAFYTEPVTGIRFGAWMDFAFPSSLASQHADQYLSWKTGVVVGKTFEIEAIGGGVDLSYQFRFTKNFHGHANPTLEYDYLPGIHHYPGEGVSTEFGILNRLSVTLSFLEKFYATMDFVFLNNWKYDTSGDIACEDIGLSGDCNLHSPNADVARGRADATSMTIELGYQPIKYLTFALGVTTYQPPKTSDNSGFRWPLNFGDASANYTSVYLDLIGTY